MRPSDRIKKDTLRNTEAYRFSTVVEMVNRYDSKIGSYVQIKVIDDDGEYVWIALVGAEKHTRIFNKAGESNWLVAVFQSKAGGYKSAFGVLIPREAEDIIGKVKGKDTHLGKLAITEIVGGAA